MNIFNFLRIDSNNTLWRHVNGTNRSNESNLWFHWNGNITRNRGIFEKIDNDTRFRIKSSIWSKIYANLHDIGEFFFQFSLLHLKSRLNLLTLNHLLALINRIWDFSFYLQFLLKEYAWLELIMHEIVIHFTFKSENSRVE